MMDFQPDKAYHAVPLYFQSPTHAITIDVAGAGGTGSLVLTQLVRLHRALIARGQGGLHVRVFDPDTVSESNLVRQHFSVNQLGVNKAVALVTMINRVFGLHWEAFPVKLEPEWTRHFKRFADDTAPVKKSVALHANIVITCVDTVAARKGIDQLYQSERNRMSAKQSDFYQPHQKPYAGAYYWLDLGNGKDYGQAVLGTWFCLCQPDGRNANSHPTHPTHLAPPSGWVGHLGNVLELYPNMADEENKHEPSCSALESLARQDLTINQLTATFGVTMLWRLCTEPVLSVHGIFFNSVSMRSYPLPVVALHKKMQTKRKMAALHEAAPSPRLA